MFCDDPLWTLDYDRYDPTLEKHAEALCTTGNGYMGCRGAMEEANASEYHYPGTYIAGIYNRLVSEVGDREIENEDFVNCPDWTCISFETPGGALSDMDSVEILSFRRQLNLAEGTLLREMKIKHTTGEITTIRSIRFTSMAEMHLCGIRYTIIPENYSGKVTVISGLNGDIINDGVARYSQLNQLHLAADREVGEGEVMTLGVKTTQSNITVVEHASNDFTLNGNPVKPEGVYDTRLRFIAARFEIETSEGDELTLDKAIAIFTSQDSDIDDPYCAAEAKLSQAPSMSELLNEHRVAWADVWKRIDIEVGGDDHTQQILRLHAYHLAVTISPFNATIDASMPARGLHGEAYRGHIFWDELFAFPFYNMHFPDSSRAMLLYRYNRLDRAREYAREYGYEGAMFPWQSGSDGREETQIVHLNPVSGKWGDDYSSLQRHISLAVAYNAWTYCHMTGDDQFMRECAGELICDIAKFWASKCLLNEQTGRYEIEKVMGPDEFHEKIPGADQGGVKDNAYTNVLVVWLLERSLDILGSVSGLAEKLSITEETIERWKHITGNMNVAVRDGVIQQYDGFLDLKELDWDHYRDKYEDIGRLDRILKAEGLSPDDYQLAKQGDLMMLFYVLPLEIIVDLFADMGVEFTDSTLKRNYDYYLVRTSHGSTLSLIVHSRVAAMLGDMDTSLSWYSKSLEADINDIQGGTTPEGIHAGLMAGTVTVLLASYAGLNLWGDHVSLKPTLPERWDYLKFNFLFKSDRYYVVLEPSAVKIRVESVDSNSRTVEINGSSINVENNRETTISL